ncbi:MAG: nucleotidyltransferase domain-containing protein [Nanoarchaeota archaeon]|nr:nucleotidyltransferase domain-containing protein [Nanoarchaeota archaeon]
MSNQGNASRTKSKGQFSVKKRKVYKLVPIIGTIMQSKEEKVVELFFESPTREWHFEEIVKGAKITRSKADRWLKQFIKEGLIKRIKKKGKMPYYISSYDSPKYKNRKRIFGLTKLYESGLLNHLGYLEKAKTIILFGSFSRSDWYKNSDIDIFIYGDPKGLRIVDYELKLHRDIQLFICQNKKDLSKLGEGLIRNIIKGNLIKGDMDFVRVGINA